MIHSYGVFFWTSFRHKYKGTQAMLCYDIEKGEEKHEQSLKMLDYLGEFTNLISKSCYVQLGNAISNSENFVSISSAPDFLMPLLRFSFVFV